MTTDAFFAELEEVRDRFAWELSPATREAAWERRSKVRLHLRAKPKGDGSGIMLDPLGAVCYAVTGEIFEPRKWPAAGEALGMSLSDAASLHAAASDHTWTGPMMQREPQRELVALRSRLLESVGLTVAAS